MAERIKYQRILRVGGVVLAAALGIAWAAGVLPSWRASPRANALMVVAPYRHAGTWVFDDPMQGWCASRLWPACPR